MIDPKKSGPFQTIDVKNFSSTINMYEFNEARLNFI